MPDKLKFPIYLICFSILLPAMSHADDTQKKALSQEAISIVKQFGGTLKPALKKALKSEGPVKAIEICSEKAPQIAADLSKKTGWTVKRVSLKPRNSESAIPDAWETKVLKSFDQRQAQGNLLKKWLLPK